MQDPGNKFELSNRSEMSPSLHVSVLCRAFLYLMPGKYVGQSRPLLQEYIVEMVISSLTKVPTGELKIKRKYKIATDDSNSAAQRVVRWWFVIRAKESVLERLQKDWHQVALLTDSKLTPLIQYAKPNLSNNALHQQPNH